VLTAVYREEVRKSGAFGSLCMISWKVGEQRPVRLEWANDQQVVTGSAYRQGDNTILISRRFEDPESRPLLTKLIRYELMNARAALGVGTPDAEAIELYNAQQNEAWTGTNAPSPGADADVSALVRGMPGTAELPVVFYHATNMENWEASAENQTPISVAGLDPARGGGPGGSKRWETMGAERKDHGWTTVTTSYDQALVYATGHTKWARTGNSDMYRRGGIVLSFSVRVRDVHKGLEEGTWRRDDSGNAANWQTRSPIAASELTVRDSVVIPAPETAVAPPPKATAQQPASSSGGKPRSRYAVHY
jgi:hypothetical protein